MYAKDRPLLLVALVILCLVITSALPFYFKTLFVAESGNIKVISPWISSVLILAFLGGRQWTRKATLFFCSLAAFGLSLHFLVRGFSDYKSISHLFLLLLQLLCIAILRDEEVKHYLDFRSQSNGFSALH